MRDYLPFHNELKASDGGDIYFYKPLLHLLYFIPTAFASRSLQS